MIRVINLYKAIIGVNISILTAYIGNFWIHMLSSLFWGGFHIVSILLLTSKTNTVYGWTPNELLMLTASFTLIRGLFGFFFQTNFVKFPDVIFYGNLDGYLMKPISSQLFLSIRYISFHEISRVIVGLLMIFYVTQRMAFEITPQLVASYVLLTVFSIVLLYSIWFMFMSLLIWNPTLTNLKEFLFFLTGFLRYPSELYRGFGPVAYNVLLPLLIVIMPGTRLLIRKFIYGEAIMLIVTSLLFLYASHKFWNFALKHYSSASS